MSSFLAAPLALWPALWPELPSWVQGQTYWLTAACVAAGVVVGMALLQFVLAYGHFERAFHRGKPLKVGRAMSAVVDEAVKTNPGRKVVFTGHSLGGALAALAFAQFRCHGKYDAVPVDLVTFGAPRMGDDAFLAWLIGRCHEAPGTGSVLFADLGDPVPYLPPTAAFVPEAMRRVTWLSALLSGAYLVGWLPYALAYGVQLRTNWPSLLTWSGSDGISVARHFEYQRAVSSKAARS